MQVSNGMKKIVGVMIFLAVVSAAASWYVAHRERELTAALQLQIAEQQTTLVALSELIDRDGADAVVSEIVKDCSPTERSQFDTTLGNLSSLNRTELQTLNTLFSACGDYYAQRKAVMAARFEREVSVYTTYVDLLAVLDSAAVVTMYHPEGWSNLATLENARSQSLRDLVRIQRGIIDALLAGETASGKTIADLLTQANEVREQVGFIGVQIDDTRTELLGL